jgi:RNA polymerase sigma-70 factor (ECF subfamily)
MELPTTTGSRPWRPVPPIDVGEGDLAGLVARAKNGDRVAYTVLYRRYREEVYRYALVRLRQREAAEDATQAIFIRALTALPTCRENAAFVGWLFAIARSVVNDQLRAQRHQTDAIPEEMDWIDPAPGPEEAALRGEATRTLLAAREQCLTERDRELFDLLLTDLNDKEMAIALGRGHGAVRTAHWRLLAKLRDCLGSPSGLGGQGRSHGHE